MKTFRVRFWTDNLEHNALIRAETWDTGEEGELIFYDAEDNSIAMVAAGEWSTVEEVRDGATGFLTITSSSSTSHS